MKFKDILDLPVRLYDLTDYKDLIDPFVEKLLKDNGQYFSLGPDNELNKLNIWETEDVDVKIFENILDTIILDFLDNKHPRFLNKGCNYYLEKDSWLNTPTTWQGQRIHRHIEPFLRPAEIGDVTTVLYFKHDSSINIDNGCFELYDFDKENPLAHDRLPPSLTPVFKIAPTNYHIIVMASEVWHRAKPFTGVRYSLATDAKTYKENPNDTI